MIPPATPPEEAAPEPGYKPGDRVAVSTPDYPAHPRLGQTGTVLSCEVYWPPAPRPWPDRPAQPRPAPKDWVWVRFGRDVTHRGVNYGNIDYPFWGHEIEEARPCQTSNRPPRGSVRP